MGSLTLLDTNALIYAVNGQLEQELPKQRYAISIITKIEVLGFPHLGSVEEADFRDAMSKLEVLWLSDEIIERAIQLRRTSSLRLPDAVIAATALVQNIPFVSLDKSFRNIPGLLLIAPNLKQ